jgi:hypothetical protein
MSCLKKLLSSKNTILLVIGFFLCACGVKGDPVAPEKPTQLGRGRPTYRRATEGIKLQKYRPINENDNEDEDVNGNKEKRENDAD